MAASDGRVPFSVMLTPGADARALGLQPLAPSVGGVRLLPSEIGAFEASHPQLRLGWYPPLRPQLDVATKRSGAQQFRLASGLDGKGVVVGIIDTGLDVTHPDLRDLHGLTRVAWLLDLSRTATGKHGELESKYGCLDPQSSGCAIFEAADIDDIIRAGAASALPRDVVGHGTHVASIAAGNGLGTLAGRAALTGMAPEATLVAARVTRSGEDINDTDVLLAASFVFERAEAMGMPAVVNMSLGADYGPHDGTTPLERGLAEMVGPDHPGRSIVVASGNSGTIYVSNDLTLGVHTEARAVPNATTRVPLQAPVLSSGNVRGATYVWIGWAAGDEISVGVEGPAGARWIDPIPAGSSDGWDTAQGVTPRLSVRIINDLVYLGSPLTADSHGAVLVYEGEWGSGAITTILLEGNGTADLYVQGVGDAAPSSVGIGELFMRATKQGTVNVPATSPELIAVGALLNRSNWTDADGDTVPVATFGPQRPPIDDSVAYFSGSGPNRNGVLKPEISAPGAFVAAAMSRDARPSTNPGSMFATSKSQCPGATKNCMVVDDNHGIASGTSMASPMVAGAVALLFSLDKNLTQPEIVALLQAGSRYPVGKVPYPFQMGAGALDVEGARLALEAFGRPILRDPDAKKSWLVMGSSYARPNANWKVAGTLETRYSDGGIADGFDPRELQLLITEAVVVEPFARVAPGLWRFALAAPEGSGGKTMKVEARFRGELLGSTQYLPIGADPWVAKEGLVAMGGCSTGKGGEERAWWMAALVVLGAGMRRARRRLQKVNPPLGMPGAYKSRSRPKT
jgi:MYXO-CTERM domain-containing protein